jgi:predicted nucleic acid-binding protein
MSVLVDTSVWIDYFRTEKDSEKLDFVIDENLIVINDLILAELIPSLRLKNQQRIIELLGNIEKLDLSINWDQIMEFQFQCLKNGLNVIGIPDLILSQTSKQNHCNIYTFDSHFKLIKGILKLQLVE